MPLAQSRLEILQVRKLINCVRMKEIGAIKKLIENGIHELINYQDPDSGETALHVAVTHNQEAVVNLLLELGANPLVGDKNGQNSVMRACEYGHMQSLQAMAIQGVNAKAGDNKGKTALFYCLHSTMRHAKCIDFLLECGADPNTLDGSGLPILCAACKEGLQKIVERILDRGADPNAKEMDTGKSAVIFATEGNHIECLKLLLKGGADKNAGDRTGNRAVHRAAALCHFEVLQVLSAYGADFTVTSNDLQSAMHLVLPSSNLNCVRFLAQRGCPANEANGEGNTPQKLAKSLGFKDCMKELKKLTSFQDKILKGGKPKGFAENWCIQLYDWIVINKASIVEVMRSHDEGGELVGTISVDNFTESLKLLQCPTNDDDILKLVALYDKSEQGRVNYEDLLEEHKYVHAQYKFGKNDDLKAKKGKKKGGKKGGGKKGGKTKIKFPIPFDITEPMNSGGCEGTIEKEQYITDAQRFSRDQPPIHQFADDSAWYLSFPDQQYIALYEAIRHSNLCSLESALASGIPVDHRDKYNKTPLMIACSHGRKDVVKLLLSNGADVNAADNFLWTPLHHACHSGEEDIVKLLLSAGANIDAQGASGGTALMRAIESSQKAVVKLLLEHGAKVTTENLNELTALDIARNWGDDYIYAILYAKAGNQTAPTTDKKGKGDKKGKDSKGKKKDKDDSKVPAICLSPAPLPPLSQLPTVQECVSESRKKLSLSKFKPAATIKPYPNYKPKPAWLSRPPSTESFLETHQKLREERGIENADFKETRSPFQLSILARVQALD